MGVGVVMGMVVPMFMSMVVMFMGGQGFLGFLKGGHYIDPHLINPVAAFEGRLDPLG